MRLQQPQRLGLLALGLMREAGARTPLRGQRSGQTTREMLSSWRERGLNAQAQLLSARQEGFGSLVLPKPGTRRAGRVGQPAFPPRKLRMEPLFSFCSGGTMVQRVPPEAPSVEELSGSLRPWAELLHPQLKSTNHSNMPSVF